MRRIISILLVVLFNCSGATNNNCTEPDTPNVPTASPTITVVPTASSVPDKPKPSLKWYPFDLETMTMLDKKGLCAMLFFNSDKDDCDQCKALNETLKEPELISLIDDAFIPVKFPVDKCLLNDGCKSLLRERLLIKSIPTTVLVFKEKEAVSFYAEGALTIEQFKAFLLSQKELYNHCKEVKNEK